LSRTIAPEEIKAESIKSMGKGLVELYTAIWNTHELKNIFKNILRSIYKFKSQYYMYISINPYYSLI